MGLTNPNAQGSRFLIASPKAGSILEIFLFMVANSLARLGLGLIFSKPVFDEVIGGFFNGHINWDEVDT